MKELVKSYSIVRHVAFVDRVGRRSHITAQLEISAFLWNTKMTINEPITEDKFARSAWKDFIMSAMEAES